MENPIPLGAKLTLSPLAAGGHEVTAFLAILFVPISVGHGQDSPLERFGDVAADRERDRAEPGMLLRIHQPAEEFMLVGRRVGSHRDIRHARGKHLEGLLNHALDLEAGGDVAVAELAVEDHPLFGPPDVQRLVALAILVRAQGVRLESADDRGVRVEGRLCLRASCLDELEKVAQDSA
jgi:hypothetical protein